MDFPFHEDNPKIKEMTEEPVRPTWKLILTMVISNVKEMWEGYGWNLFYKAEAWEADVFFHANVTDT